MAVDFFEFVKSIVPSFQASKFGFFQVILGFLIPSAIRAIFSSDFIVPSSSAVTVFPVSTEVSPLITWVRVIFGLIFLSEVICAWPSSLLTSSALCPLFLKVQLPILIIEPFLPKTPTPFPSKLIVAFPPSNSAPSETIAPTPLSPFRVISALSPRVTLLLPVLFLAIKIPVPASVPFPISILPLYFKLLSLSANIPTPFFPVFILLENS